VCNVTSARVRYDPGPEVQFGITTPDWAATSVSAGACRVIQDGIVVLFDREGTLSHLVLSAQGSPHNLWVENDAKKRASHPQP
jgi:hypothetical protein